MPLTLAIAGRPNVGKSTLFNRLVGKSMALVDDQPGVTRDWREGEGRLFDLHFTLFDTAGLEDERPKGSLAARTADRTKEALDRADVILFMVDARAGMTHEDKTVAREIRKVGKPIILLANKCEGTRLPELIGELESLGFGEPLPLSAAHGDGLAELHGAIAGKLPKDVLVEARHSEKEDEEKRLHLAIVGRPNAGKSTLVNQIVGEERMLTGPEPGLTRDAIPVAWEYRGQNMRLVDTAGMRRRARIDERIEKMSVQETLRAIRLAHIVILVLDATMPFDKQDYTIAQHVVEEGRALVVAVNKWDTIRDKTATMRMIQAKIEVSLAQVPGVPIVPISAKTGDGVEALMRQVMKAYETWNRRVSTGQLNRWLTEMEANHPPPIVANRRIKLRYMTQIKSRPPTFAMWINKPLDLPESYMRFLTNGMRRAFDLAGVPIRWTLKKSDNPYADKKKKD